MKRRKYAIIDIETTGGLYNRDKITEIAIIVTDGEQILDEFQSLINPERSIPSNITRITGIDDQMVADAPRFYEVARQVQEITEGCVFVAHNVKFDYGFIKEEFRSLGFAYNRKRLCTVKLSRATIPGLRSYGLDSLVDHFGIEVESRHRAYDDTLATYTIFSWIYQNKVDERGIDYIINEGIDATVLPNGMDMSEIDGAPEVPGVYYLSNQHKRIIYVGKAKNIRSRLFQHFRKLSRKSMNIHNQVHHIHYKETGHELIALLLELHEIKTIQPEMNKALRRNNYPYALYYDPKVHGERPSLHILKHTKKNDLRYEKYKLFGSKLSADGYMQSLIIEQEICCKKVKSRNRQFQCVYNHDELIFFDQTEHIETVLSDVKNEFEEDFVLLLPGRDHQERSFVMVHEGRFWGIGFIPADEALASREQWNDHVSYQFFYPEANGIIKTYMEKKKVEKVSI